MLRYFIGKVHSNRFLRPSPRVLVCVPFGSTDVERRAIKESAEVVGARSVDIVPEPMAAAVGAGLPVHEARGSMVVDIGGGTSEVGVVSLNGIVYAASVRVGGDKFDEAITQYVRRNYGILIGEATAERIKIEIGAAYPGAQVREILVTGRNLSEGVPRGFTLNSNEILEALQEPLQGIVGMVKQALEQTTPDLGGDVAERGIVLTGGGALLRDMDELIMEETGLPVLIADDPLTCVARGGGRILELTEEHGRADGLCDEVDRNTLRKAWALDEAVHKYGIVELGKDGRPIVSPIHRPQPPPSAIELERSILERIRPHWGALLPTPAHAHDQP